MMWPDDSDKKNFYIFPLFVLSLLFLFPCESSISILEFLENKLQQFEDMKGEERLKKLGGEINEEDIGRRREHGDLDIIFNLEVLLERIRDSYNLQS